MEQDKTGKGEYERRSTRGGVREEEYEFVY
jgi:hypothetical protein